MTREDFNFMFDAELYSEIRKTAAFLHESVNQMYGDNPYVYHLDNVAEFAVKFGHLVCESKTDIAKIIFGAYFHDVIEDTRQTYNDVFKLAKKIFTYDDDAKHAAEIVYALTNEKGRNRAERENDKYFEGLRAVKFASYVKMCDRLANINYSKTEGEERMFKCYKKESPDFLRRILYRTPENEIPQEMLDFMQELLNDNKAQ